MRRTVTVLLFLLAPCGIALAQPTSRDERVALVIGNADYRAAPLKNPLNDARVMADRLRKYGFKVVERQNLRTGEIAQALREFRTSLNEGVTALFYYAGHGVQIRGVNYLLAVDADIVSEEDVPLQAIDLNRVLEVLGDTKSALNLVFLDACRDNPMARSFRSSQAGLAKVDAPSGTLISFATRPGSTAADGRGDHGLYTEHLLLQMNAPNVPIEQVLKRVTSGVKAASRGRQEPWMEGSIEGEFFFVRAERPPEPRQFTNSVIFASTNSVDHTPRPTLDIGTGKVIEGAFRVVDNVLMGEGTLRGADGKVLFTGTFANGKPKAGKGSVTLPDGATYEGGLLDGNFHGRGEYIGVSFRYNGGFKHGKKDGDGTYIWPNGNRYEGRFADDRPDGVGKYFFANGDRYEGEVKAGLITGKGTYVTNGGDVFEGSFMNAKIHGDGIARYANGDRYEGPFVRGTPSGNGRYFTKGGDRIEAPFESGKPSGRGIYQFANGDRYEGDIRGTEITGSGVYYYRSGLKYEGEFRKAEPGGKGVFWFLDGSRFEAEFESGFVYARGEIVKTDGSRAPAEIVNGSLRLVREEVEK